MKIRMHRGSLDDSIKTEEIIDPTRKAVASYVEKHLCIGSVDERDIDILPYGTDNRIRWERSVAEHLSKMVGGEIKPFPVEVNTWVVTVRQMAVAFSDSKLDEKIPDETAKELAYDAA